ncbi:MAG TPA: DMT family transporter [Actinomycetota bacterium]|nr:DMT family transporter [Actinomycetota bacterium]
MRPRHAVLLVLGVVAVSTSAPLIRLADAPPLAVAFYRNAFGALALLPIVLLRHRDEVRSLERRDAGAVVLAGALLAVHFAAWIPSVTLTTVAASTVLVTTQPIWAAAGERLLTGERVRRGAATGIALALAGAALISGFDFVASAEAFAGDLLALLGAITAAGYLLTGRRLRQRLSLPTYAALVYGVCSVLLLAAVVATGTPLLGYEPRGWLLFASMAAGPQILGHTVFNYLLRDVDATVVAVAIMGEPVGASVLALALFGEVPPASALVGGALVLIGIYVAVTAQTRSRRVAPVE